MTDEKGYNGWSNYETWATALWMDNEEGSYRYVRELAREIVEETEATSVWTKDEAARFELEDRLKDEYEEAMPELEGVWSDLLRASFGEIDWLEIATNLVEEASEDA